MYESYWKIEQKPFENRSDPRFYYPGESHQAALLKLRYAIENRRGAALLAGPSGSGKTLLLGMLQAALDESYAPFVHLVFPQMSVQELLAYLAVELGQMPDTGTTPGVHQSIGSIVRFLQDNTQRGKHAVVAIDEAHLISDPKTLEALRLLLNFEFSGQSGMTLLLVGQPGILPVLDRTPQLEERLGVKCLLRPLAQSETTEYVGHRLNLAGASDPIFDTDALRTLHELTHGIARRVNRLCDLAMLIGYAEERSTITSEQLESVSQELVTVVPE